MAVDGTSFGGGIAPYTLLAALALLGGFGLTLWRCRDRGIRLELAAQLLCLGAPCIFLGGKLAFLMAEGRLGDGQAWLGPGYGLFGALGGVLFLWFGLRIFVSFPLFSFLDCVTPSAALALCLARIGCFFNGCCSGVECAWPWAVRFPAGSPPYLLQMRGGRIPSTAAWSLPVHPYQLYEALFGLIGFAVLWWAAGRRWKPGRVFFAGAAAYGVFRFLVEPLRVDFQPGTAFAGLSPTQALALGTAVAGLGGLLWVRGAAEGRGAGTYEAGRSGSTAE